MPNARQVTPVPAKLPRRVVSFTVPLVPPSGNHYKKPCRGRDAEGEATLTYRLTAEAKAFKDAVAIFARGDSLDPVNPGKRKKIRYGMYALVVHGPSQYGDGDNYWKVLADGIEGAGVIHSDARVKDWFIKVDDDDRENARTEIIVTVLDGDCPVRDLWREIKGALL